MAMRTTTLSTLRRLKHFREAASTIQNCTHISQTAASRQYCSSSSEDSKLPTPPPQPSPLSRHKDTSKESSATNSFIQKLIQPNATGESPVLRLLGFYSPESKAIGAANSLYTQIRDRSKKTVSSSFSSESSKLFVPQFEILALHIYLTLRRLRLESGSPYEADIKMAMQTLFDNFWTDVRYRMMMDENKLTLLQSGKWMKQCEKNFFAMALEFDEVWNDQRDSEEKMLKSLEKHISSLRKDRSKLHALLRYLKIERRRLEKTSVEEMWEGNCWDPKESPALV